MIKIISQNKSYQALLGSLENIKFKSGVSLLFLLRTFYDKIKEDDIQTMAGSIAFNFTLSLFPGIIFLFTLIPYFPIDNLTLHIKGFMMEGLPVSVFETIWGTVEYVVDNKNGKLLSFGFFMAIYLSKNGMLSIMSAFNNVYSTKESRSIIKKQLIAIMLTFSFVLSLFVAVVALVLGNQILQQTYNLLGLEHEGIIYWSIIILRYFVISALFLFVISFIYYFAPTVKRKFNFFSAGSFMATIMIIVVSKLFAFYVDNFDNYNKLYGSIGALLGLMFFFFAISLIILVGFQVNASIDKARHEMQND